MLRAHPTFAKTSQLVWDLLLLALAFYLAYAWRLTVLPALSTRLARPEVSADESRHVAMVFVLLWPWVGLGTNLYGHRPGAPFWATAWHVLRAVALTFFAGVTVAYFTDGPRYSRATLIAWAATSCLLLWTARLLVQGVLARLRRRGHLLRRVLVVGRGSLGEQVLRTIHQAPTLGFEVVGYLGPEGPRGGADPLAPRLGDLSDLGQVLAVHAVDQVLLALPIDAMGALPELMETLSRHTVDVRLVPDLYQVMTLCGRLEDFFGLPMIALQTSPLVGLAPFCKRAFDLAFAALALVLCAPLWALIALAIRLGGPGPILYRQRRVGLDGRAFSMLKFRTMAEDAEARGARMTAQRDPRCTPVGAVLRRLSLDELPQLLNVLRGDMSLVGPRPEQPSFSAAFVASIPRYALRHKIKAGMTGWAQIHGLRGNTSIARRIELDLYYIENWSLVLDFKILVRTVMGGFLSPHAY